MLIQITTVSAFLDVKHFDKNEGEYGQIEIDDWLFLNKADYKLTDYGTSVINAWAEGEYTLYKKTHLFTGIFYKDILGKEGELKNAEFFIWETKFETKYNPIYENDCHIDSSNGTATEVCESILVSNKSYQADISGWTPYEKGMDIEEGEGRWRLEAERPTNKPIDFILEAHGQEFEEWIWWYSSWDYKKPITINSSSDLTDYQFNYTITYDGDMQGDFDDIRFTYSNSTAGTETELSYWFEVNYTSDNATVWIKSDLETGDNTIYMYYGNAGATTTSSGTDTFIQFNGSNTVAYLMPLVIYNNYTYESKIKATADVHHLQPGVTDNIGNNNDYIMGDIYTNGIAGYVANAGTSTDTGVIAPHWNTGEYHNLRYEVSATGAKFFKDEVQMGSEITGNLPNTNGGLSVRIISGTYEQDWAFIRKYTATVPTVTSTGSEESGRIVVTSISPVNHYNSSSQNVDFECNATDETGIYSLNLTINGKVYKTVTGAGNTNLSLTSTETLSDGTYEWYCTGNDDTEAENSSTRYLTVDITFPTINVSSPISDQDYFLLGNNETLNWTVNDTNLDSCWYNYNSTNTTVTCGDNTTIFEVVEGLYNLTFYANDSAGNENSQFLEWRYNLIELSQTYPTTSIESATEIYTANLNYNSSTFGVITGKVNFNGTEYTGTRTGSSDSAIFAASVIMPSIEAITNFTAYWTISLTNISGITNYNLTSNNVTVNIINMSLCGSPYNVSFWNFTILNESNAAELNSTFEATFTVKETSSTSTNEFSYSDTTGNNSQFDFCISPSTESYTIDTNIKLTKSGYVDKFYNFEEVIVTNSTREDNLYMLAAADSTSFIIHVVDVKGSDIEQAEVRVQRYYPGTGNWLTTEIVTTNYIGEAIGHLLSEDVDYRFIIYQSGVNTYNSTATKIICAVTPCTVTLVIPIDLATGFEVVEDLTSTLTFSSTTNIFTYTYDDTSGDFTSARLRVLRIFPSNGSLVIPCNGTKTDSSGVITCNINGQVNGTYRASGYITRDSDEFLDKRIDGVLGTNIYNSMGEDGVLWSIFILIAIVMLGITRPSLAIVFGTIGLITLSLLQIINIGAISIISVVAIAIILLMQVGKE